MDELGNPVPTGSGGDYGAGSPTGDTGTTGSGSGSGYYTGDTTGSGSGSGNDIAQDRLADNKAAQDKVTAQLETAEKVVAKQGADYAPYLATYEKAKGLEDGYLKGSASRTWPDASPTASTSPRCRRSRNRSAARAFHGAGRF